MEKFNVSGDIPDKEKYRLILIMFIRGKLLNKALLFVFVFHILIFALSFTVTDSAAETAAKYTRFIPLAIPVILLLLFFISPWIRIRRGKAKIPDYEIDQWGLSVFHTDNPVNVSWPEIENFLETPSTFLLLRKNNKLASLMVPKNGFRNNEHVKEFIDFLHSQGINRI